jgi:hypothetical protein
VVRYDSQELHEQFGSAFRLQRHRTELHKTPKGLTQQFTYCFCRLEDGSANQLRRDEKTSEGDAHECGEKSRTSGLGLVQNLAAKGNARFDRRAVWMENKGHRASSGYQS